MVFFLKPKTQVDKSTNMSTFVSDPYFVTQSNKTIFTREPFNVHRYVLCTESDEFS